MSAQTLLNGAHSSQEPQGGTGPNGINNGSYNAKPPSPAPIAIIGMSCKFGGDATSPSKLWDLCAAGKDGWAPIPGDRFDVKSLFHPVPQRTGRNHVKGGYFLEEDVALFDAAFFNLSGDLATAMDPQLRLLMESVYEAIENAGIPIEKLCGSNTSVFSGLFGRDYYDMQISDSEVLPGSFMTGNGAAMFSNRISHFFDLKGASMTIDTGCSTGMVALHQACRNIQSGDSDISIVGSASVLLSPDMFTAMSTLNILSAEGRCYAWDDRASGYGRGEGIAALILKRLDVALQDGDFVHAVIRDSGLNQDGKTTTISSPSMEAQLSLIEECYKRAGLDISATGYVEAHMTGTPTGDPIEAEAIARSFGKHRKPNDPVLVGSIKTNVGHTEPVSGLAAIIKTTFVLRNGLVPPNLNYKNTNPKIPLQEWNLKVPTTLTPWPQDKPLRASVNNFGYGGTNAHVILESAPNLPPQNGYRNDTSGDNSTSHVYIVSSKDSTATQEISRRLAAYIRRSTLDGKKPTPADLAYTLAERRSRFPQALAVKARSLEELVERLEDPKLKATRATRNPRIGFVFNGQGAQWYAMGRELITAYPIFGSAIQQADQMLREYGATWSLNEELMRDEETTRVHTTNLSQPITVALQLALVDLLKSWGITPSAVTSHSSGEIAAAYAVGALSFKEALGVVYFRGDLALKYQKISSLSGGMLAAGVSSEKAEDYIKNTSNGKVVVACVNSPDGVTLSGDTLALDEVASRLEQDGVFARRLKVTLAYHSYHMQSMAQEYLECLRTILPMIRSWSGATFASPVTGDIITSPSVLGPEHWVYNLTSPVLFYQAFENMCFSITRSDMMSPQSRQGPNVDIIVEIGAHSTLSGPISQILKKRKVPYISCLKRYVNSVDTMQDVACELVVRGYPIILSAVNSPLVQQKLQYVHDLPSYAWNHTSRYWTEPRKYREHRYKRFSPHELLGTSVSGANCLTPTWRNFLNVSNVSWLTDHRLESKVVLPGASYIAMAIEAVRLLTDPFEKTVLGYRLRDIDIMNALTIPDSPAVVETQLCLRPCSEKELDHKGWYEFELCSVSAEGAWIRHCKGYISAETATMAQSAIKSEVKSPHPKSFFTPGSKEESIYPEFIFAELRKTNIWHGPTFQNLIDSRAVAHKAITTFNVSPAALDADETYVLHPTTLDSIFQAFYVCVPEETKEKAMVVPRFIRNMFVPRDLKRQAGEKLRAFTNLVNSDRRGATSQAIVINDDEEETASFLHIEGFYCQGIPRINADEPDSEESRLCAKSRWEPDILHDFPGNLLESWKIKLSDAEVTFEKQLRRASYHFIYDAVLQLEGKETQSWQWHHQIFYTWMKSIVEQGNAGKLAPGSRAWSKTSKGIKRSLFDDVEAENAAGQLTCRVGYKLASIIQGEVTPLELMMEDNLLNRYYQEHPSLSRSSTALRQIVALYAVKQPGARVLEIGAGTGSATSIVLEGFGARAEGGSGSLLDHYDFTDISTGFFEAARAKYGSWGSTIDFKKLDIEVDPVEQSFVEGSYDLIVASVVLHATKSLIRTVTHVRKLLKPGGKLILLENTQDRIDRQFIFGTLSGWWLSEEPDRKMSPNVPVKAWDNIFRTTGFTGVDFEISDCEEAEFQSESVMVTTAVSKASYPLFVTMVYTETSPPQAWLTELVRSIQVETGAVSTIQNLENVHVRDDHLYIFTPELTKPFVDVMDSTAFERLRKILTDSLGVLWLSCSSTIDAKEPLYAQAQGLLRTLKQEDSNKRYVQLDFESTPEPFSTDKIQHIIHVLQQSFDYNVEPTSIEWEYAVKDSMLHVPRFYPDIAQDMALGKIQIEPMPQLQLFFQSSRQLVWEVGNSGLLSDLCFKEQAQLVDDLPSGIVEIESKAFGLNFRDIMVALGQLDETLMGHECAGIVSRLGPGTEKDGLKVGDRVCGLCKSRFATKTTAFRTAVAKIPDYMSWEEAASIPAVYVTAYIALFDVSKLEKGERILIHAATGGVGQAALMLAKHIGAEIFVTCGTETKRDFLIQKYGIASDHIFSSRDTSFAPAIMAKTGQKGVDVVLNSLAGPLLKATWECIARFGRFVEIGKVDFEAGRRIDLTPLARSATITGIDLLQYNEYKGKVLQNALTNSIRLCQDKNGVVKPVYPITPYSISDMEKAMRQMQGGRHMGKLVLVPRPGDEVKVISPRREFSLASAESTYMIVGGLGGIGRTIASWMIKKGAKNILVVSRGAASHPDAASLCQSAKTDGCNLCIRSCDVSNEDSLINLLADCARTMAPIRGVIQAAMHLDDTVMERMSYEQWQHGILPKVAGTMNLHKNLTNLSFFIMLSSLTGVVGNVSQSNYAAGNSFQDALARKRTSNGLPAVVIDLGPVSDAGFVAEADGSVRDRVEKNLGHSSISTDQMLRLIEAAIREPLKKNLEDSQIITCISAYDKIPEGMSIKKDRRFGTLRLGNSGAVAVSVSVGAGGRLEELVQAMATARTTSNLTVTQAGELVSELLINKLAMLFNIPISEFDTSLPLSHFGVDSLVAVELRNWLTGTVKTKVTIFEILQSTSLLDFAALIAGRSGLVVGAAGPETLE